ncbi:hypothetical protein DAPPUDRAFT_124926, partial [Daphnia pulex]
KQPSYQATSTESGVVTKLAEISGFHTADLTVNKVFFKNYTISGGIKNLFDVTRIQNSAVSSGTAHSSGGAVPMSYGSKVLIISSLVAFVACKEEVALPDNLASFATTQQGLDAEEANIQIALTRATDVAIPISIQLTPALVAYDKEFTTEPAAVNNVISATIPIGASGVTIKVKKKANVFLNGDENISLKLTSVGTPVLLGLTTEMKLSFAAITSVGSKLTLEGKTAESPYANNVYADLSANFATLSGRKSWNLGFYHGGQFRVILNHSYQSSAAATTKTDISAVTLADTASVPNLNFAPGGE